MKFKFEIKKVKDIKVDAVASFCYEDDADSKLEWLNTLYKGGITSLIDSKDFTGKHCSATLTYIETDSRTKRLLVAGLGKNKEITLEKLRKSYANASKKFNSLKLKSVGFEVPDLAYIKSIVNVSIGEIVQAIAEGVFLSQYSFKKYFSKSDTDLFEEIIFFTDSPKFTREINDSIKEAKIICDAVFVARDFANEPSNKLTPANLADGVKKISQKAGYSVTIFDEKKIKQINMGGVSSVGMGSINPPRFLILQYFGSNKSEKPIVLIGKGVCFDSGGISIKLGPGMEQMKIDMGGAASVIGAFEAVSRLKLKMNVIGLIPAVENMPAGNAFKPSDVIRSYSGTSIEVQNTDAEGRLILADALDYAANYKPKAVIDLATLTGAALVTFGHTCAGIMGTSQDLIEKLIKAGNSSYERVWQLPLYDEFDKLMNSDVADIKNIGPSRLAGTILGGIFLKKFVGDKYPWAHIDIAGTAINPEPNDYTTTIGTGFGVRLIVEFLKHYK